VLLASLLWAWGTGENGDLGFAVLSIAVGVSAFIIGAWAKKWWVPVAMGTCWYLGWMTGGSALAPDSYISVTAFAAPAIALLAALGVGAARGWRSGIRARRCWRDHG
jgi:hypothetical protein